MDTKTFAKMIARQVGPGSTEEIFLLLAEALFFAQPAKLLEGLARAGAIGQDGLLRQPLAEGREEVKFVVEAGFGAESRDPRTPAKLLVWCDQRYGRTFFRRVSLDFAAVLK